MACRVVKLLLLLLIAWCVMTLTHELGHVTAGWAGGGQLVMAELRPWRLPYSLHQPDPHPLVTLWGGPILGVVLPTLMACAVRRNWVWLIAGFCLLANGTYLAVAWFSDDAQLDTQKLLHAGAAGWMIWGYSAVCIGAGYGMFRRSVRSVMTPQPGNTLGEASAGNGHT